jgi:hypothetical protein
MSRPDGNTGRDALKVGELVAPQSHDNAEPSTPAPRT